MSEQAYKNTDRELWRGEHEVSDYYADSVFVTEDGRIGFNVAGYCVSKTPREWMDLAWPACRECETRALHPPWCSVGHRKAAADKAFPPTKAPCPGCGTHHSEYGKCPHDTYLEAEPTPAIGDES